MSTASVVSSLTGLRRFGPYLLVELLLPGGTLIALLLWLSQRFVRTRFAGVRQYLFGKTLFKTVIAAKPHPGKKSLCLCLGHTAVLGVGPQVFRQVCESPAAAAQCCT